ncbi:MAG: hypothetical protein R2705_19285 [Ilumatobacteraceae bacterium]
MTGIITELQAQLATRTNDYTGWATLGLAYVQQAKATVDPSYYDKAQGAGLVVRHQHLRQLPRLRRSFRAGLGPARFSGGVVCPPGTGDQCLRPVAVRRASAMPSCNSAAMTKRSNPCNA